MPAVLGLIRELALFEKAPDAVIVSVKDLVRDGFGRKPLFKAFVAENEKGIVGMALLYTGYSTWKGKLVYLDDLIVKASERNKGIGKLLMDEVIHYASKEKARVLKWQVLRWNKDAIRFYKRYGNIVFDDEWVDCKMYKPLPLSQRRGRKNIMYQISYLKSDRQ
ncbi:MAG TPA: GNAT family N-acetyltransferase [Chitinophagales bacterium]|nr:GNAT family N-acetyltransferase [Chitinophagales bacterium]